MNTIKNTRIATCCNWIFFLFAFFALFTGISKQASAQTAIANPGGITPTLAFTDTRAIGFPNGQTYTYTYASWPACTGWGLPTVIPVINGNVSGACGTYSNVTFNAAPASPFNIGATTNLAGGVAVYTGTTTYQFWTGSGWNTTAGNTNVRLIVTVTNGTNPMALQQQGAFIICPIPDPSATIVVNVKLQAYGPTPAVYATTGTGTTIAPPAGNTYTCANYASTWAGAIQLFNCISTNGQNICTQFPGTTNSWVFYSGVVPAAPAAPTGAVTICTGGSATLTRTGTPTAGTTWYWQTSATGTDVTNSGATFAVTPASTTTYYLRPRVGTCWGTASAGVTVTVVADPALTAPTSNTVCVGASQVISTVASGGTGAFSYQWQYSSNGTSGWANVVNATPTGITYLTPTAASMTIVGGGTEVPQTAYYRCVLSSTTASVGCNATSANSVHTIVADPVAQTIAATYPTGTTLCVGAISSATFSGGSGGTGTITDTYEYSNATVGTWVAYTSGTNITFNTAGTPFGFRTRRSATGAGCTTSANTTVSYTVVADPAAPTATKSPNTVTVCAGATLTLVTPVAGAGGTGTCTFEYRHSTDNGVSWSAWSTTVSSFAATGTNNRIEIRRNCDGGGCTISAATQYAWTVVADPALTTPASNTVCVGASQVITTVASGGTGTYSYRWQYSSNGTTGWANTSNGTPAGITYTNPATASMTIVGGGTEVPQTAYYRCVLTSLTPTGGGCDAISGNSVHIIVADPVAQTVTATYPNGSTLCLGGQANATFSGGSGGTGTITNIYEVANVTANTWVAYIPPTLMTFNTAGTVFGFRARRTATGNGCTAATSTVAYTVVLDPSMGTQPAPGTICSGGTRTLTATVNNGTALTYQWEQSTDNVNFVDVVGGSGATTLSYTTPALSANLYHRLRVNSGGGGCLAPIYSNSVLTTVVADPALTAPTSNTVCVGASQVISTVASGGTGTYSYRWQYSSNGTSGWANTSNGTPAGITYTNPATASMTIVGGGTEVPQTAYYRCVLTSLTPATGGCDAISGNSVHTIVADPVAQTISATYSNGTTLCVGAISSATFSGGSGGTGTITNTYEYSNATVGTWVAYTSPNNITFNTAGTPFGFRTRRSATGVGCTTSANTTLTYTVVADPAIGTQPTVATICDGGSRTLTATVNNGTALTYQWEQSTDNSTFVDAVGGSGATTLSYTTPALSSNLYYRLRVTSTGAACTTPVYSNSVLTTVVPDPVVATHPAANTICSGGTQVLTSTLQAGTGTGTVTYQWEESNDNGVGDAWANAVGGSGAGTTSYTTPALTASIYYRLRINHTTGIGCTNPVYSNSALITVVADPTSTNPAGATICLGTAHTMTVNVTSFTGTLTYQWQKMATNCATPTAVGTNSNSYTTPTNLTAGNHFYRCVITSNGTGCGTVTTTCATVTVLTNISGTTFIYTNPTSCTTSNGTITVSGATGGSGTYNYSRNSTDGSNGTWQASGSFTGIADGASGQVWVRNSLAPYCPVYLGTYTMQEPHEPISAATTSINPTDLCSNNIATLTASNMAPGNGGNGGSGAAGPPAQPALPTQGAFTYNGTTQYSACNTTSVGLPTGSSITVEAWIKPAGTYAQPWYNGLVTWGARSGTGTTMGVCLTNAGRPNLATWGWDLNPTSGPSVVANTWSHIAVTLNGATVTTYINGMQAYQANLAGTPNVQALAAQWLTIGCLDAPGRYFSGSIDNVRIWAVVRTQGEIQSDMYKNIPNTGTVTAATLRANYMFNLGSLLNNGPGAGPTLNVNTGVASYPAAYSYTWSGANSPGDNPPATIYEQVTVGPLQGISNYQVIATTNPANGCTGTLSTLGTALINDFTSTPFTSTYATSGSAQGVTIPGTLTSGTLMGRPNGVTYSYTYAQNLTTGAGVCTNWGVPTTIANVVGVGSANTSLTYVSGSPTDLNNGIVAFRGTIAVPANYFWAAGFGSSPGFNWNVQLVFTVRNGSGGVIRGDFVSSGDIMFRINSNFTIKAELQAIPPAGRAYMSGSGQGGTSCATIAAAAGGTTYYSILDVYDCMAKVITTPQLYSSFNFDKFPKFVLASPISTTTPISVCHGGNPSSAFKLQGNTGSIPLGTTNCGGLSHTWLNSAGTTVSTLQTTNAITADATTAPASPGTIYNYVVSNGVSNICYGSAQATVSRNIAVVNGSIWSNGAVGTTYYGTVVPTVLDPTQQVTGNDSWYDNRNWDHCVPDAATNSYILYNATNPANINSNVAGYWGANAKTKFLKIDVPNGAKLMINANGTTKLNVTD